LCVLVLLLLPPLMLVLRTHARTHALTYTHAHARTHRAWYFILLVRRSEALGR
jgi:hypothetical protein